MKRLLLLKPGPYFPATDISVTEKYKILSNDFEGDIIAIVNKKELRHVKIGNFNLKGLYLPKRIRYLNIIRNVFYSIYAIVMGVCSHHFLNKYDVIIAYDPLVSGFLSYIIGNLTGAKIIVEVNGNYSAAFISNPKGISLAEHIKQKMSKMLIPFVLAHADGIKLLYQNQLDQFKGAKKYAKLITIFHDFVPIRCFKPDTSESKYILFMGFPWFLKGVDILIKAFNKISDVFPEYTLKIVGYCDDKSYFKSLSAGNRRIQLCDPVHYQEAIKLIENCSLFVLPSRTEAMGRVLLESMAARKPIIASNVEGIPTYIKHGFNGVLFESGNVEDLVEKMSLLLGNQDKAKQLAENGYYFVNSHLSERCYIDKYRMFVAGVLNG